MEILEGDFKDKSSSMNFADNMIFGKIFIHRKDVFLWAGNYLASDAKRSKCIIVFHKVVNFPKTFLCPVNFILPPYH